MQARDIMTAPVIFVGPGATIAGAIELMLKSHISGLPVVDADRRLVGMLSEGDLLRRAELGTERHRPRWIEAFAFLVPGRSADDYVHTHGRLVEEVMTRDPIAVEATTPVEDIVTLMERKRIKRMPVLSDGELVGIVTRADLLRALATRFAGEHPADADDKRIREAIESEMTSQAWAPGTSVRIAVKDGVVELEGVILDDRLRDAIRVSAENTPGVKAVHDRLVYVEPFTGAYIDPVEEKVHSITVSPIEVVLRRS
jgi:CBS domain-containing protein